MISEIYFVSAPRYLAGQFSPVVDTKDDVVFEEAGVDKGQAFLQFLVELEIKSNGGSHLEFTTKSRKTKILG